MGIFYKELQIEDEVEIKDTNEKGVVTDIHPNPFLPPWLVKPNYSVRLHYMNYHSGIYKRNELKFISRQKQTHANNSSTTGSQ